MSSARFLFWCVGLGLVVGAIFHTDLTAQATQPPPPPVSDSARRDSVRAREIADSLARADTLREPLRGFPAPPVLDDEFVWRGDSILASGALSLAELIARLPGVGVFRAGSPVTPSVVGFAGCFRCVRVYLDGIELTALDPRSGGVLDHAEIPLSTLEEVRVVRGAGETRVYLRTWSIVKTIPFTQLDILTGSDETSLFSARFGRRFKHGEILQLGGQQYATTTQLGSGTGDHSQLFARIGIAKTNFSIDATANRTSRFREPQENDAGGANVPSFEGSRTDAYLRFIVGRPDSGGWVQLVAASQNVKEKTPGTGPPPPQPGEPPGPSADTSRTESQYVLGAGTRFGLINASAIARLRSLEGERTNEVSLQAHATLGRSHFGVLFRRDTRDSTILGEVSARLRPLSFVQLSGSVGQRTAIGGGAGSGLEGFFANADVGIRIRELWLHGGAVLRDSISLAAPIIFDESLAAREEGSATGTYVRANGSIWRDVFADFSFVQWDNEGWYRPKTEANATLYLDSWWPRKFPNRTFHIYAGISLNNRGAVTFPTATGVTTAASHSSISSLIEIRIMSAVISWQNRNIRGLEQSEVPGLLLPRRLNVYGVRWVLWN